MGHNLLTHKTMQEKNAIHIISKNCDIGLNTFCQLDGLSKFEYNYSLDRNLAYFEKINNHKLQINTNLSNVQQISNKILSYYYSLDDNQKRMLKNPEYWKEEIQIAIKIELSEHQIIDKFICEEINQNSQLILENVKKQIDINTIQYFINDQDFFDTNNFLNLN